MITKIEFTPAQQIIIKEVCLAQLSSLTRVHEKDTPVDVELVLAQYEVDEVEFKISIASTIERFEQVYSDPTILSRLDIVDINIFKHILYQVEDDYHERYPNAISNLWRKLFILEKYQNTTAFGVGSN